MDDAMDAMKPRADRAGADDAGGVSGAGGIGSAGGVSDAGVGAGAGIGGDGAGAARGSSDEMRVRRRLRRRRVVALLVMVAAAGLFGRFAYLRITRHPTPRTDYWEAQIAAVAPMPPGAVPLAEASRILSTKPWSTIFPFTSPRFGTVADFLAEPGVDNLVLGVLQAASFPPARAEVLRLAERGWDTSASIAPWPTTQTAGAAIRTYAWSLAGEASDWSHWLRLHSRWVRRGPVDTQAVEADWLALLMLSLHVERLQYDPYDAHGIRQGAAEEMIFAVREGYLPRDPAGWIARIRTITSEALTRDQILERWRLMYQLDLEDVYVRDGGWLDVAAFAEYGRLPGGSVSRWWNLWSPLFHSLDEARARVDRQARLLGDCRSIGEVMEAVRKVDYSTIALTVLDGSQSFVGDSGFGLLHAHFESLTYLDAAVTVIALEAHHRAHGRYPDGLDELVPELLPRMPIDHFDGQPLRYRLEEGGYVLYSIGMNQRDDDGKLGVTYPQAPFDGNLDIVFSELRR